MAKKKNEDTVSSTPADDFFAAPEPEATAPAPPAPPKKKATKKKAKAVARRAVTTLPNKVKALSLEDLAPELQREPGSWEECIDIVMGRQAARGVRQDRKQAKRAARIAWPEIHEAAGSPRI